MQLYPWVEIYHTGFYACVCRYICMCVYLCECMWRLEYDACYLLQFLFFSPFERRFLTELEDYLLAGLAGGQT